MNLQNRTLNVAVIGAGIAGLSSAWSLSKKHAVTLYEQNSYLGGHSNTVDVRIGDEQFPVDTGFIVFNPPNYPYLVSLFEHLKVETISTNMSFGVSLRGGKFEYAGSDLNGLFAQRSNLFKPRFWRMIKDIRRFYSNAQQYLESDTEDPTQNNSTLACSGKSIGELLRDHHYSSTFIEDHLVPMAAAIWSASREDIVAYPADAFIRFFANHGLLELGQRPVWHTVKGGSREYVKRLVQDTSLHAQINAAVVSVVRHDSGVTVIDANGQTKDYDNVVFATHADEALGLLDNATETEQSVLGTFRYSNNTALLHRDTTLMPVRRAAWCSWNYLQPDPNESKSTPLCVSYWMNRLQGLDTSHDVMVTLNPSIAPNPDKVIGEFLYTHPIFDHKTNQAQKDSINIQGADRIWFCGSYLGHGFHEDGIESGLWVAEQLGSGQRWHQNAAYPRLPSSYRSTLRRTN